MNIYHDEDATLKPLAGKDKIMQILARHRGH